MRLKPAFLDRAECAFLARFALGGGFEPGRQGTGYEKRALMIDETRALRERCLLALGVSVEHSHDCYLLRYQTGSFIPKHRDAAPEGKEHRRINCMVTEPSAGGLLIVEGVWVLLGAGDAYAFRPDIEEHEVSKITGGTRLVFTVGTLVPVVAPLTGR